MANIVFGRFLHCSVVVQNDNAATDEEWDRWIALLMEGGAERAPLMRVLVFSAGGSPTARQRGKIHALMPSTGPGVLTAVVIGSPIGRAVVGAMALFNRRVKAFKPNDVNVAFGYLGIPEARRRELFQFSRSLHAQLDIPFAASL